MRRLVILGLILVILAAIWSGGWFALAAWADGQVPGVLARIEQRGVTVDCGERRIVGFPFALKVACGATSVAERHSGAQAQLAGLTGGGSVFAPRTAQIALASPARIESPLLAGPAELSWASADLDVGMGIGGPQAVSFDADEVVAAIPLPGAMASRLTARSAGGDLKPGGDGGTDASFAFTGLALSSDAVSLPPFDCRGSVWLSVPPRALYAGPAGLAAPLSARNLQVLLESGEARLQVEGDVAVDAEGLVDGTVALRVAGVEDLPAFIAALPAGQQRIGNAVAAGMLAFGRPATIDGDKASELVIEIVRGRAKIGPLTVSVPRLPLPGASP